MSFVLTNKRVDFGPIFGSLQSQWNGKDNNGNKFEAGNLTIPANSCTVSSLKLQDHCEQSWINVPNGGKDERDDGETRNTPNDSHFNLQKPGS